MTALKDILDEQARIKQELQRMEDSEETTEEADGDLRDTLVERWQLLDEKAKPIIERMERVRGITRAAQDPANLEGPDGTLNQNAGDRRRDAPYRGGNPDLFVRRDRDPYEDLDSVAEHMVRSADLRERALNAVELENKRANLAHDYAENATRMLQDNGGRENRGMSEHILLTGSPEYQEAFRNFIEHPTTMRHDHQDELSRVALALGATGSMLPFVLDQMVA